MPIIDAYGERKYQQVQRETWGHLAPEPGQTYRGAVMFAHAAFGGDTAFLSIDFTLPDGTPLNDNPWSYEDITNYIIDWICDQASGYRDHRPIPAAERFDVEGRVFSFTGSYTRFKNNNYRIIGKFRQLTLS